MNVRRGHKTTKVGKHMHIELVGGLPEALVLEDTIHNVGLVSGLVSIIGVHGQRMSRKAAESSARGQVVAVGTTASNGFIRNQGCRADTSVCRTGSVLGYLGAKSLVANPLDVSREETLDGGVLLIGDGIGNGQRVAPREQRSSRTRLVEDGLSFVEPSGVRRVSDKQGGRHVCSVDLAGDLRDGRLIRRAGCPLVGASNEVANETPVRRGMDLSRHFKEGDERNCEQKEP